MAPLPENNTGRLFIEYTSAGRAHTLLLRYPDEVDGADAAGFAGPVIAAMKGVMASNDAVTGARFSAAGSNVSFPVAIVTGPGTGSAWTDPDAGAGFASWTGRSADGRDVKYTVFNTNVNPDTLGYRALVPGTVWQDFLDAIDEATVKPRTISEGIPFMNSYVNYGYNSYWQRKLRRGG